MTSAAADPENPLLTAALAYAARGFAVCPLHTPIASPGKPTRCSCRHSDCRTIGKHPRTIKGLSDASTDPDRIRVWWEKFPDANVAIRTGDGLCVVDVDARKGGLDSLAEIQDRNGKLPLCPTSLTGGGGQHLLFKVDRRVSNSVEKVAPGIDVRGDGGYIVAPPSLHESGRTYEWELSSTLDAVPLGPMPPWLFALVTSASPRPGNAPVPGEPIPEGKRNDTLYRLACSLRAKGLSEAAIRAALDATNAEQCRPPLDALDVEKLVASACRHPPGRSPEIEQRITQRGPLRVVRPGETEPEPQPVRSHPRVFDRGDSVELGTALLMDLQDDVDGVAITDEPIVHDGDAFHRYAPARGTWDTVPDADAYRRAALYAGRFKMSKDGVKPISLTDSAVKGIVSAAQNFASRDGFFNTAAIGVAFANGFLSLVDGVPMLAEHAPAHRAQHPVPFAYEAGVQPREWIDFLGAVFCEASEDDRAARIALLQEFGGACLFGLAPRYGRALILLGEGHNGKSQVLTVLRALFPPDAVCSLPPQVWSNRFLLSGLIGKRCNVVNELPARDILDSEVFKNVVTGEPTIADKKHRDPVTLVPRAGHVFAANTLPDTMDHSLGFWRRLTVLLFDHEVTEAERVYDVGELLVARELPAIMAWFVEGAARLVREKRYTQPESSSDAKAAWKLDADQVAQFVDECCDVALLAETRLEALYLAYQLWSKDRGTGTIAANRMGRRLGQQGHARRTKLARFYGLTLKPEIAAKMGELERLTRAERMRRLANDRANGF